MTEQFTVWPDHIVDAVAAVIYDAQSGARVALWDIPPDGYTANEMRRRARDLLGDCVCSPEDWVGRVTSHPVPDGWRMNFADEMRVRGIHAGLNGRCVTCDNVWPCADSLARSNDPRWWLDWAADELDNAATALEATGDPDALEAAREARRAAINSRTHARR